MRPKYLSGYQKRKKKEKEKALIQSQAGDLDKYFSKKRRETKTQENVENVVNESTDVSVNKLVENEESNVKESGGKDEGEAKEPNESKEGCFGNQSVKNEETNVKESGGKEEEEVKEPNESKEGCFGLDDLDDPGNWKRIDHKMRDYLVEMGPKRVEGVMFPKDARKRHFDISHFSQVLPSGKTIDRRWLIYSVSKDRVYCFCCKLFLTAEIAAKVGQLTSDGFKDWHNLGRALKNHDKNQEHLNCMCRWGDLESRIRKNATIDKSFQVLMNEEKVHGGTGIGSKEVSQNSS